MLVYTNIQHEFRKANNLSCNEYVLCDMIYKLAVNPESKIKGWCYAKRETLAEEIGISKQGVLNMIERLIMSGFLIKDDSTKFLKTTEKWNKTYFTNGKQTLPDSKQSLPETGKQTLPKVGKQSLPNNNSINNNSIDNNNDNVLILPKAKSFKQFTDEDFKEEIKKYLHTYKKEMLIDFYNYWSEKSASGVMRFQLQKTWETERRLITWKKNEKEKIKLGGQKTTSSDIIDAARGAIESIFKN